VLNEEAFAGLGARPAVAIKEIIMSVEGLTTSRESKDRMLVKNQITRDLYRVRRRKRLDAVLLLFPVPRPIVVKQRVRLRPTRAETLAGLTTMNVLYITY